MPSCRNSGGHDVDLAALSYLQGRTGLAWKAIALRPLAGPRVRAGTLGGCGTGRGCAFGLAAKGEQDDEWRKSSANS